jgi:hypothetical protein
MMPMPEDRARPAWNSPAAAALLGALLSSFATWTTDRVTQAATTGSTAARIELLEAREREMETRFVSKDEFSQFSSRMADMQADLRDIKQSLEAADRKRR